MEPTPTTLPPSTLDVLLLSNSRNEGQPFLAHARAEMTRVAAGRRIVFLPFALEDWDAYTRLVQDALEGLDVVGAHQPPSVEVAVLEASCVFVGGGNTFRLLRTLQQLELLDPLAARVRSGACAYIGSSAGTNLAAPSIRTTNDMPIVEVFSLRALGLVPFQINPHYTDRVVPGLVAESRADRLAQFHEISSTPVVGLYEGAWVRVSDGDAVVGGPAGDETAVKVFEPGRISEIRAGDSLLPWWREGRFDDRMYLLQGLRESQSQGQERPGPI